MITRLDQFLKENEKPEYAQPNQTGTADQSGGLWRRLVLRAHGKVVTDMTYRGEQLDDSQVESLKYVAVHLTPGIRFEDVTEEHLPGDPKDFYDALDFVNNDDIKEDLQGTNDDTRVKPKVSEQHPEQLLHLAPVGLLVKIANGELDIVELALIELRNRGRDAAGHWTNVTTHSETDLG